jgi:hypothetical protein
MRRRVHLRSCDSAPQGTLVCGRKWNERWEGGACGDYIAMVRVVTPRVCQIFSKKFSGWMGLGM